MIVVIDTNVLIPARVPGHPYHRILMAWMAGDLTWAVSTEILLEYQEVITARAGLDRWRTLERLIAISPHLVRVSPTYRFGLISADPDDNKFSDAAIVAEADFVLTDDAHFASLAGSGYRPRPIAPAVFIREVLDVEG